MLLLYALLFGLPPSFPDDATDASIDLYYSRCYGDSTIETISWHTDCSESKNLSTNQQSQTMNGSRIRQLKNALELDKKGKWHEAHRIVQEIEHPLSYEIHGYLHRKEGDIGNAGYWYRRASASMPKVGLQIEWESLGRKLADY